MSKEFRQASSLTPQACQGHDEIADRFRSAIARGRLASTFLFVGPEGIGKRMFAQMLGQALLCSQSPEEALDPCGRCESCIQAQAGTHPDIEIVSKPKDKSELPVALFIGTKEKRMQEGLCHNLSLKPFFGRRRIAIIDDADYLNEESANALLKTLEEPPPKSILILIGTSLDRQLPTIRSRCQTVRFSPLSEETLAELILREGLADNEAGAKALAARSEGSLARARERADADLWKFRQILLARLADPDVDSGKLAEAIHRFVEEAGAEAIARRARLRQIITFAADFYRHLIREKVAGTFSGADQELREAAATAARNWQGGPESAADRLDRCLEALHHVDRNANQSALIAAWIDDLVWRDATARV